jgi:hypothetical protein
MKWITLPQMINDAEQYDVLYCDGGTTGDLQLKQTELNMFNLKPRTFSREVQYLIPKKLGPCLAPSAYNIIFVYLVLKSICCEDCGRLNGPSM